MNEPKSTESDKRGGSCAPAACSALEGWYQTLVALARERNVLGAISNSAEDHRDGFEEGLSPEEELEDNLDALRW